MNNKTDSNDHCGNSNTSLLLLGAAAATTVSLALLARKNQAPSKIRHLIRRIKPIVLAYPLASSVCLATVAEGTVFIEPSLTPKRCNTLFPDSLVILKDKTGHIEYYQNGVPYEKTSKKLPVSVELDLAKLFEIFEPQLKDPNKEILFLVTKDKFTNPFTRKEKKYQVHGACLKEYKNSRDVVVISKERLNSPEAYFILSHEQAHLQKHHPEIKRALAYSKKIIMIHCLFTSGLASYIALSMGLNFLTRQISQCLEEEADTAAANSVTHDQLKAGIGFFEHLSQSNRPSRFMKLTSTHPPLEKRIHDLTKALQK